MRSQKVNSVKSSRFKIPNTLKDEPTHDLLESSSEVDTARVQLQSTHPEAGPAQAQSNSASPDHPPTTRWPGSRRGGQLPEASAPTGLEKPADDDFTAVTEVEVEGDVEDNSDVDIATTEDKSDEDNDDNSKGDDVNDNDEDNVEGDVEVEDNSDDEEVDDAIDDDVDDDIDEEEDSDGDDEKEEVKVPAEAAVNKCKTILAAANARKRPKVTKPGWLVFLLFLWASLLGGNLQVPSRPEGPGPGLGARQVG